MYIKSENPPKYESGRSEPDSATKFPQISKTGMILKLMAGATVPKKKKGLCLYYIHHAYNIIFAAYCLGTLLLEVLIMKDCFNDLNRLIRDWGVIMTHLMGCVKAFLMYRNEEKLNEIDATLKGENLNYEGDMKVLPLTIITDGKRIIDSVGYFFALLGVGVGICGYIAYMLKFREAILDGSFPVNITCEHLTPFPCYIFFEADTVLRCNLALFFYFIALEIGSFSIVGFDIVFAATIITIKANFQIIGNAFNSIRERSLVKLGYSPDLKVLNDEDIPGLNEQMLTEITKTTFHFQRILRLCTVIEDVFGLVILFQMIGSLLVTSALLCLTSTGDLTPAESVSNIQFYSAMTFELSIFCYFGNELTQAYEELRHFIYNSNWLSASSAYKKHMLMTLSRLQRPVYVTIGKLSPLTLSALLSVVRASFSVLTLYKSVAQ